MDADREKIDVFVHDRQTGATRLVSRSATSSLGNDDSVAAAIAADGRFVACRRGRRANGSSPTSSSCSITPSAHTSARVSTPGLSTPNCSGAMYSTVPTKLQSSCREVLAAIDDCEFRGTDAFRGWLFTAVLHKLQKRERDARAGRRDPRRERPIAAAPSAAEPPAPEPTPSQHLAGVEREQRLRAAIQSLPPDYREVLELARIAEVPRAEIARRLGRSEASVRSLLTRALRALSEQIGDETRD